ncbi:MAG: hypothetical protein ACRD22_02110, partial [Terriglobia bacterium]
MVEDQVRVEEPPEVIEVGLAVRVAVGVGAAFTVTVACAAAPEQFMEYVVLSVGETESEPDVPFAVKPVPMQEVALVEDQVRVEEPPEVIEVGLAVRVA